MEVDQEEIERIRYFVGLAQALADRIHKSTLDLCWQSWDEARRRRASDCAHREYAMMSLHLDCVLLALDVDPWPTGHAGESPGEWTRKPPPEF